MWLADNLLMFCYLFQERPSITLEPAGSIQVNAGEELRIVCSARGDPTPMVSWERLEGYM